MDPQSIIDGRYRITEELGRGSFGTTYAAEDLHAGGYVAIKQLDLRRVDDWKAVELFEREARVLASLDHPQIPNYVEFVPVAAHHTGYLVQELAPGSSLEARLAAGERFTEAQVREIAEQLLDVLVYLAKLVPPVVHRDIKPGNVIMSDGAHLNLYLVDFGSVRDAVEASSTGGSTVAGTFGYMAPEQLHGEASPRSDLFGLGMTLVHLLTGTCPAELERKRLKVDFRPHVQLSSELADFVDRLIEPISDDRFLSPKAALEQLRGVSLARAPSKSGGMSGGLAGGMSGDAIAASVAHEAQLAEQAARREQALIKRRIEQVAVRARPRVHLVEDSEGFTLTLDPTPLALRFLVQLPLPLFLTANPGFVVAGGVPFFGPYWPIFADNPFARFVIWGLFLMSLSLMVAALRARRLHLRVAGQHFAAWTRDPNEPLAIGPISALRISDSEPGADGYGAVGLGLADTSKTFTRLSSKDLEVIARAKRALSERASQHV